MASERRKNHKPERKGEIKFRKLKGDFLAPQGKNLAPYLWQTFLETFLPYDLFAGRVIPKNDLYGRREIWAQIEGSLKAKDAGLVAVLTQPRAVVFFGPIHPLEGKRLASKFLHPPGKKVFAFWSWPRPWISRLCEIKLVPGPLGDSRSEHSR